jgi:fluoride ion exporter CrcB/FEX
VESAVLLAIYVKKWFADHYLHPIPWGTFVVNIVGCFAIGFSGVLHLNHLLLMKAGSFF